MNSKYTIFYLIIFFLPIHLFAQKYGFSIQSTFSFSSPNSYSGIQDKVVYENQQSISTIRGSLGTGKSLELNAVLFPHENIGMGLNYTYFRSNTLTNSYIETHTSSYSSELYAIQTRLQAFFMFKIPLKKISFLMKAGVLMPLKTKSYQHSEDLYMNGSDKIEQKDEFRYNFSFGYTGSIGFEVKLIKGLHFQTFLSSNLLSLTLKDRKTTSYVLNDQNVTSNLSTYQLTSIYNEDINNFSNNESINPGYLSFKSKDELTSSQSFNSLGWTIGLTYQFNKKKKK